ncbi:TagK domain-containing protein [Paraburkholderia sp. MMS20-SJTN17]|uniref:TagK domain-containing protein n=1 Tax=Paraburkholderia translucens TaxID=2886945 RepID=A0ABS8KCS9_9BURK|nr:TagK domain-containing protein [Paraburkholderia sp. MMS20-SJTN17]MCC8402570.1 TagK domain-containing protein [Paraburkholderia sp. MMS20-SJTN17]
MRWRFFYFRPERLFTNARFPGRSDPRLLTGQAMTGYQARWEHSPLEAHALRTLARTIQSVGPAPAVSRNDLPERSDASPKAFAGSTSRAGPERARCARPGNHADLQPMPDFSPDPPREALNAAEDLLAGQPSAVAPAADRIEPALPKLDEFSELIALAGEDDDDPLQLRRDPHAPERVEPDGLAKFLTAGSDASDPLAALTLEYRQALLSQKSGDAHEPRATSADRVESAILAPQDPFAELVDPSQTELSVSDLLTKGENIDTLLESLDSFDAGQIFKADQTQEILTLLAPRGVTSHRASRTPQLVREEHHLVSMDSHIAMPDSIEYEATEFPDEHTH